MTQMKVGLSDFSQSTFFEAENKSIFLSLAFAPFRRAVLVNNFKRHNESKSNINPLSALPTK